MTLMHDLRWIREHPEEFDRGLARRGLPPRADEILALDRSGAPPRPAAQEAQARRNRMAREIGAAKKRGERRSKRSCSQIAGRQGAEAGRLREAARLRAQIDEILAGLPNLPAEDVPDGPDETANRVLRHHGEPPQFDFAPLSHEAIGERLGMMDFARAGEIVRLALCRAARRARPPRAGARRNSCSTSIRASSATPRSRRRCWCATKRVFGTGQLPKFAEDLFRTTDGYWLIPTAEVPLTNLVAGEILDEKRAAAALHRVDPVFPLRGRRRRARIRAA